MFFAQIQIAELFGPRTAVFWAQLAVFVSLLLGSLARWLSTRTAPREKARNRMASLAVWWVVVAIVMVAIAFGRAGAVVLCAAISLLAMREYLAMARTRHGDWRFLGWVYFLIPMQYLWIYLGSQLMFLMFIPVCALLLQASVMVVRERKDEFTFVAASLHWGTMLTVFFVSHAAALLMLPDETNPVAGPVGWFLYLVILTESNDIAQALIGRRFGRHPIAPVLSPHKTVEGLVGGVVATTAMAVLMAPILTPFSEPLDGALLVPGLGATPCLAAVFAGVLIGIGGFLGDLTISGVKRDAGVKDSGTILPGQGGVLDRVDSLIFTAPLFYYYVCFLLL